jgi:hypothetical protein
LAEAHEPDLVRSRVIDQYFSFPSSPDLDEWRDFHDRLAKRIEMEG